MKYSRASSKPHIPNQHQRQQGDVLFVKVDSMPTGGRVIQPTARGYVVAEGEATGHAHVLSAEAVLEMREVNGVLYARIADPTALSHDEHHANPIEPGVYAYSRVQEYDHFTEEARQVRD